MTGTYHNFERGASLAREQQKIVVSPDPESPGESVPIYKKKKTGNLLSALISGS